MTEHLKNLYKDILGRPIWNHIESVKKLEDGTYEILIEPHYSMDTGLYYVQHFWELKPNKSTQV